jgi:hypothetical protein
MLPSTARREKYNDTVMTLFLAFIARVDILLAVKLNSFFARIHIIKLLFYKGLGPSHTSSHVCCYQLGIAVVCSWSSDIKGCELIRHDDLKARITRELRKAGYLNSKVQSVCLYFYLNQGK